VPDAYELPRSPGHGLLKHGTEPLTRFKAAYVSAPYHRPAAASTVEPGARRVLAYTTYVSPAPAVPAAAPTGDGDRLLDILVGRARRRRRRPAERQVDRPAHAGHRARVDPHAGRGAGVLPGLRRRSAHRRARTAPRRRRRRAAGRRGGAPYRRRGRDAADRPGT